MLLLLLPGDGIGPEVTAVSARLARELIDAGRVDLRLEEAAFGGASLDRSGEPLTRDTLDRARQSGAVLVGAVGGPRWASLPYEQRPEAGLLRLRRDMDVYANLRPCYCFPALSSASSLKADVLSGLDIMFVRELVGGVYFGEPRGVQTLPDGERRGVNTHVYTSSEIRRVARVAFAIARTRRNRVCSVDKANVMEAGLLWREEVTALRASEFPDVDLDHMLADNAAMQLVRRPAQFDVVLTDNLFGDILSDVAAMLTGSIGLLASGAVGAPGRPGLYEPIHGSAPDIAGRDLANPCASVLSLAMAFRHSLGRPDLAGLLDDAVEAALVSGARTADLGGSLGTEDMGAAIADALRHGLRNA